MGFDNMLKDLLIEAKNSEGYKFDEIIYSPEQYLKLTNHIFHDLSRSDKPSIKNLMNKFYHRGHYKAIGDGIQILKMTGKKHSKQKLRKFLLDIISMFVKFNNILGYQTPDGQLTEENCFLTTSCIKYSSQNQFETILVFDRNDDTKKLSPLSYYQYLSVPNFCYDYEVIFFIKDDILMEDAIIAWNKFKKKHQNEVYNSVED